jgi:hypothetical protein
MNRIVIARAGAVVAFGFLLASAFTNWMFGASLGRTPRDAALYAAVGVFAVAMNALLPFFLSWSLAARRKVTSASVILLWALCLTYSTTSALGFAALNREGVALSRQVSVDAYEDTRAELADLQARRSNAKPKDRAVLDARIDDVRNRLDPLRRSNLAPPDPQSAFLSALTFGIIDTRDVRIALAALFAIMVELCATFGLFVSLSHAFEKAAAPVDRWTPRVR